MFREGEGRRLRNPAHLVGRCLRRQSKARSMSIVRRQVRSDMLGVPHVGFEMLARCWLSVRRLVPLCSQQILHQLWNIRECVGRLLRGSVRFEHVLRRMLMPSEGAERQSPNTLRWVGYTLRRPRLVREGYGRRLASSAYIVGCGLFGCRKLGRVSVSDTKIRALYWVRHP